eukprot:590786-Amphidinium_carterae.1
MTHLYHRPDRIRKLFHPFFLTHANTLDANTCFANLQGLGQDWDKSIVRQVAYTYVQAPHNNVTDTTSRSTIASKV